jgi:RNA polymerase sigma-70 factor (ECF subfamily)
LNDTTILELYESRNESAISETAKRYGSYCLSIAVNILQSREDSEEIVNDTYLKAWNAIPPERPTKFASFLGVITKNLSLNRYKASRTQKRSGRSEDGTAFLMLSELEECVPASETVETQVDAAILREAIEVFLTTIPHNDEVFFLRRYWHNDSIADVAERFGVSESRVKSSLFRTRNKLKAHLEKEGVL